MIEPTIEQLINELIGITVILVILIIAIYFLWRQFFMNPWKEVSKMGHMKYWSIFGFEWWGAMRPASMKRKDGIVYRPLFLGVWIKKPQGKG